MPTKHPDTLSVRIPAGVSEGNSTNTSVGITGVMPGKKPSVIDCYRNFWKNARGRIYGGPIPQIPERVLGKISGEFTTKCPEESQQ